MHRISDGTWKNVKVPTVIWEPRVWICYMFLMFFLVSLISWKDLPLLTIIRYNCHFNTEKDIFQSEMKIGKGAKRLFLVLNFQENVGCFSSHAFHCAWLDMMIGCKATSNSTVVGKRYALMSHALFSSHTACGLICSQPNFQSFPISSEFCLFCCYTLLQQVDEVQLSSHRSSQAIQLSILQVQLKNLSTILSASTTQLSTSWLLLQFQTSYSIL